MPFLLVNSTSSLPIDLNGKEVPEQLRSKNGTEGNLTNYSRQKITPVKTPFVTNNVLIIVLLTMAVMFIIALCAFCCSCFLRRKVPQRRKSLGEEPNAPSRQQLQEAFDFQRRAMLEPQKETANLSESQSSFRASLSRWASVKNLPGLHSSSEQSFLRKEKLPINYATTPRSVFATLPRKWSESSAKRIEHLRTKLVARFPSSSQSTSDISVFFSTSSRNSEWGECSQLNCGEDKDDLKEVTTVKTNSKSGSHTKRVPSIVIEFVE